MVPGLSFTTFLVTVQPHAAAPPARVAKSAAHPSQVRQLRRAGTQKSKAQARAAPPKIARRLPGNSGRASIALLAAMVVTVNEAVAALVPVICTGLVEPKLKVGTSWAPAGVAVTAPDSPIAPVNPPLGVMVMVEMFPLVAPAATLTAVPAMANVPAGRLMV